MGTKTNGVKPPVPKLWDEIPEYLKQRQYVLWRNDPEKGKVPLQINGQYARTNDPSTWASLADAVTSFMLADFTVDGIGTIISGNDDLLGIDIDNCINPDGSYNQVACDVLGAIGKQNAYAEVSPSGTGLKVFLRGKRIDRAYVDHDLGLEIYYDKRYFTVTGQAIEGYTSIPDKPVDVTGIVNKYFPSSSNGATKPNGSTTDAFENYVPTVNGWSLEDVRDNILTKLDPNVGYSDWLKVGMALHHQGSGAVEWLELFDEWSAQSDKYKQGEPQRKWNTFAVFPESTLTLATLIKESAAVKKNVEEQPFEPFIYAQHETLPYKDPPTREFLWDQWIPMGAVTSLYGTGGVGKSFLAQQIGLFCANGRELFGHTFSAKGSVFGYFTEDDNDEILRRSKNIMEFYMFDKAEAGKDLYLTGRAGCDNILISYDTQNLPQQTKTFQMIEKVCKELKPALIILDNVAQLFGGVEIVRVQATSFVNQLTGLAKDYNCAVLLLGHVAKKEGSQYSGSTAWDAAVRTRLLLERTEDGIFTLHKAKANYAAHEEITLEQKNNGVFEKISDISDAKAAETCKTTIKECLPKFTKRQVNCSHKPRATNNLVSLMISEGALSSRNKQLAITVMNQMIDAGELIIDAELGWKNSSRHPVRGLALVGDP